MKYNPFCPVTHKLLESLHIYYHWIRMGKDAIYANIWQIWGSFVSLRNHVKHSWFRAFVLWFLTPFLGKFLKSLLSIFLSLLCISVDLIQQVSLDLRLFTNSCWYLLLKKLHVANCRKMELLFATGGAWRLVFRGSYMLIRSFTRRWNISLKCKHG